MTDALSDAARDEAAHDAVEIALEALDKALVEASDGIFGLPSSIRKLVVESLARHGVTPSLARLELLDRGSRSAYDVLLGHRAHQGTEHLGLVAEAIRLRHRLEVAERSLAELRQLKLL